MTKKTTIVRKIRFSMKCISKAFLIALLGFANVFATGQSQTLTLSLKNMELKEALQIIEKNSEYRFLYRSDDIIGMMVKKLDVHEGTINDVMGQCLPSASLSYEVDDNLVIIRKETVAVAQQQPLPVVRGSVTDMSGSPMTGVSVSVKGTQTAVVTDRSGEYSISVQNAQSAVLVFTFIGMKTIEMPVAGRTVLTVVMEDKPKEIGEVVVMGYQTLTARESASSTFTVKAGDVMVDGVSTIDKTLQGRIPGMLIMNTSGEPSSTPKIRIRGNATISGNKSPLWVVDGVILEQDVPFSAADLNSEDAEYLIGNAIAGLNPRDIETISVLKDASATAVYGVKAANGVIVLTTKKGVIGKPFVTYAGDFNINQRPSYRNLDLMDSRQRVQLSREIAGDGVRYGDIPMNNDSYEGLLAQLYNRKITDEQFSAGVMTLQKRNTDWFGLLYRNVATQSHSVNVSGGSEGIRYYVSAGYNSMPGAAIGSDSKRFTSMAKIDATFNRYVELMAKIDYSTTENTGYYSSVDPFNYAYSRSRTLVPYNDDGSYRMMRENGQLDYEYNIFNELANTGQSGKSNDFNATAHLKIKLFVTGLKYEGTFSLHNSTSKQRSWATDKSYAVAKIRGYDYGEYNETDDQYANSALPYGGTLSQSYTDKVGYTVRNGLSYVDSFGKHAVNAIALVEIRSNKYTGLSSLGYGWSPDFGEVFMPVQTTRFGTLVNSGIFLPVNTNRVTQIASFIGSASYVYDDRYVFNANIRSDGANKFGSNPKYRWQPVWSVAGKWRITSENFMQDVPWVSDLSLKGSYGLQGNIHDDSSPYMILRFGSRDSYSGMEYYTIYRLPNPDLRWEKTGSWNVGLEFSLFENRLSGSVEVYRKNTKDLIMSKDIPSSNGRTTMMVNAGRMVNKGYDLYLRSDIIRDRSVEWRLGVNFSRDVNQITRANMGDYTVTDKVNMMLIGKYAVEGAPIGSLFGYKYAGLNDENGYPMFYAKDGSKVHFGHPEMMELVNCGSIYPDLSGGFDTQITYKRHLSLSVAFAYSLGGVARLPKIYERTSGAINYYSNVSTLLLDRWRQPGDKTDIPKIYDSDEVSAIYKAHPEWIASNPEGSGIVTYPLDFYNNSDLRTAKTDFLRLQYTALSYRLPESFTGRLHVSSVQVRFQASNLFVIADKEWRGVDPETPNAKIPLLPTYSLGLNITF